MKIELSVVDMGHVPSFKNAKRVAVNHITKRPFLATRKDVKKWMTKCIHNFELQLFCASQTTAGVTLMGPQLRSLIVSSLPHDDSVSWIPVIHASVVKVDRTEEGATIIIEKI